MESDGILRPSISPFGSRIVLVGKKDGALRMCGDFRDVNKLMAPAAFDVPLPRIDEALQWDTKVGKDGFLHTLDLSSGFWTMPVVEEDKPKLAVVTRRGKWEYNVLPFGAVNAPALMQTLMERVLRGLTWEIAIPYLDDILIWGDSYESSFANLRTVFERLRLANLSCRPDKCHLFCTQVEYLGHLLGREGLSPNPAKVEVINNFKAEEMNTLQKVRSFLGMAGYFRRFVKNFALIARPLTDATSAGVNPAEACLTPEFKEAVEALKHALVTAPVLATPDSSKPFILKIDAATDHGVGVCLQQPHDDPKMPNRVVQYWGTRWKDHGERTLSATEAECLALVKALKTFRWALWGRKFTVHTDHHALQWLYKMKDEIDGGPASKLVRWAVKIQEYNFDIVH